VPRTAAIRELPALKERASAQPGPVSALEQSALQIEGVTLGDGRATIRPRGQLRVAGECDNPRVAAQPEATARRFAAVKGAAISLNGRPLSVALSLR
jgi:hypothetical protein